MGEKKERVTRKKFWENELNIEFIKIGTLVKIFLVLLVLNIVLEVGMKIHRVYDNIQMNKLLKHQAKNCLPMG